MANMDKGVLLIAYNNDYIAYEKLAALAARSVKQNMLVNHVTLLTDTPTFAAVKREFSESEILDTFDHIIVEDIKHEPNSRAHRDSPWYEFLTQFNNKNKHSIFEKSPYRQTLMIDVDYFIGNNSLDAVFDTDYELAMYKDAISVRNYQPRIWERKLQPNGIDMWWSTVIYWRNDSETARLFFDLWQHVKENYQYYKWVYKFPGALFRTDYAVSIASHILNGQIGHGLIQELPGRTMRFSEQIDDIVEFSSLNDYVLLCPDPKELWKNICSRIRRENVHLMNKMAILRHYHKLKELAYE
jgi:hypothetical protein